MGTYLTGMVEGFYGRPWSWHERRDSIGFLGRLGLGCYVYAPKSDPFLRRRWEQPWPESDYRELAVLGERARLSGVSWGVGLSPFEAYLNYDQSTRVRLKNKLKEINSLEPDILCVLFDDMRGDLPRLASLQAAILEDLASYTSADRVIMCPTYYSHDPILERVFGQKPPDYWRELGGLLDPAIDFFWTGDKVCSTGYPRESLVAIGEMMQRAPVLWDNYPVNDGASMCRFLRLRPFSGRPQEGVDHLSGHLINPMSQAGLSRIVMATLPFSGEGFSGRFAESVRKSCPEPLAVLLERDMALFADGGLDAIAESRKRSLLQDYGGFDHPCAREVCDWLRGVYAFDPACLTD